MQDYCPSLEAYLELVLAEPWLYGVMDCCRFGGRWVEARTGRRVFYPEDAYVGAHGALTQIKRRGGMHATVRGYLERVGVRPTPSPEHGDLGLVRVPKGRDSVAGEALVIRCATRWIGRTVDGVCSVESDPYACWRVE